MVALPNQPLSIPEADYLKMDAATERRYEYLCGYIWAMSGRSNAHSAITMYTGAALVNGLGDSPCTVYSSDLRVKVETNGDYAYPDVSVVCGDAQFSDDTPDTLLNPVLLVEVLSPSTEVYDRTTKLDAYIQIPSLQDYLLISQQQPYIRHYARQSDTGWTFVDYRGRDAIISLTAFDVSLKLADVYRKVTFDTDSGSA
jgi:Uma2 family endonuclease